ncbi:hypothetical protein BCR44DRAFT_1015918 [Catenaria anguillulae PL171]|uniref:C5a peptidase/Subtilisin-like protease SBT2-like Fn3-like domain-containing protein n=1 Tax=Catenaria anguillulae PL171 TaxID=765915 RepID=A0A1Y2HY46_9FUNG|nr:hypothetical protein BCR44DRAFT_1015918 [Catenaria anguillulae PL171]
MAGVIALEIQRNGASKGLASYESLQRRLHITSRPALLPGSDPKNPVAESVAKTGAGLVNVPALLANPLDVNPSKLELGDGFAAKTRTITVTNNGNRAKRYTIGHLPSRSVEGSNGVPTVGFKYSNTFAKVSFSSQIVSVAPGQSASFVVTVDPVAEQNAFWIRSGFITLTDASDEKPELSIPYALLANDYGKYPVFDSTFMPALVPGGAIDDPSIPPFEEDAKPTFDLKTKETSPAVLLSTVFPVRRLTVALVPADKPTNVLGYLLVDDFAQNREAAAILLNAEVQDVNDETKAVPVEDGEYRIVIQYVRPRH